MVAVPIDGVGREIKDHYVAWRLPLAIRCIVQLARSGYNGIGKEGVQASSIGGMNAASLKNKTLLLWDGRFTQQQITLFRLHYPYRTEVVDMPTILEALRDRDPGHAILVCVDGGGDQTMNVFDAATRDLLYAGHEVDPYYEFDARAVKKLTKAVE